MIFKQCIEANKSMDDIFCDSVCGSCGNLGYYDWYFCNHGKHCDEDGFIKKEPLKECELYTKREGKFWIEEMSNEEYRELFPSK